MNKHLIIINQDQVATLQTQTDVDGLTIGTLTDGTTCMTESSLARLCGVSRGTIESIAQDWNKEPPTTRIATIQRDLAISGYAAPRAYVTACWEGITQRYYHPEICASLLHYFAHYAGSDCRQTARESIREINQTPSDDDQSPIGLDLADLARAFERNRLRFHENPT